MYLLVWRDGAPTRNLYHWRLSSGQEVDFILEQNGQLLPVEVKAANTVGASEARHVVTFRERHAHTPRGLACPICSRAFQRSLRQSAR